jgi:hypothetical protein
MLEDNTSHTTNVCWFQFDEDFVHDNRVAAMASSSFGTHDSNWYMDCSATDHITSELAKLTMHERYNNND